MDSQGEISDESDDEEEKMQQQRSQKKIEVIGPKIEVSDSNNKCSFPIVCEGKEVQNGEFDYDISELELEEYGVY